MIEAILTASAFTDTDHDPDTGPTTAPGTWIRRLSLSAFRNYRQAVVESDGRPVVLTGPNGAGKTNLLEAVSFLAPGRGLRRAKLAEVQRRAPAGAEDTAPGADAAQRWALAAAVMTPDGPRDIGTGQDPNAMPTTPGNGNERRVVRIDGAPARSQQALAEILSLVWLTPQLDGLFREGATARRRFFDRLVYGFDPAHAGRIAGYEHNLRERARLLRDGGGDGTWLAALEEAMAERAVAIAAARRELCGRLAEACAAGLGRFPAAGLGLAGDVESWLDEMPALAVEERLRHALSDSRRRDAEAGGAAVGPHRTDLAVHHVAKDQPANLCSTGEQKALLISIVLAHARLLTLDRGAPPLLLLDEVAAHLDETRRESLFDEILALGAQAWLTGTDMALFDGLTGKGQFFGVQDAVVRPLGHA